MDKTEATDHLRDILESDALIQRLEKIAFNYPNLKQEGHIRNAVLEIFNYFNSEENTNKRAVAEHRINGKKVDLCFVNKDSPDYPVQVEFKFQFSKDFNRFSKYRSTIEHDLESRESDAFVLIVADWEKEEKKKFDKEWALKPDLNKYICNRDLSNQGDPEWKKNLCRLVNSFDRTSVELIERQVDEPYQVKYYFYLLIKHSEEDWETVSEAELFNALESDSN